MFLTRECDYAVRVVRSLADSEKKAVNLICEEEHVPIYFAYKILKKLEKAKIVQATRGAVGGYQLATKLNKITLLDIVTAIDTDLLLNACLKEGFDCTRDTEDNHCKVHIELSEIQDRLVAMLQEKTMDQLCDV